MKPDIGLQLFSLRNLCAENFENVLKGISEAGYDGVEFYSFFDIKSSEMKELLKKYNLKAMGTHTNTEILTNDIDGLIDYCRDIDCKHVAIAIYNADDRDGWLQLCEWMEEWGEKFRENGITFMYHNHDHELKPVYDGETAEEIILKNTSPENVSLELDFYWAARAGLNPVEHLRKNLSRVKILHFKDMADKQEFKMTEVGAGVIEYSKLYDIAVENGFKWVIVEQDSIYIDPFESIKISIDNIKKF